MNARYFDAHCHVQFDVYDMDQAKILEEMRARGVAGIVVGVDAESSEKAAELAGKYDHLVASVGLHPNRVAEEKFDEHKFRNLLSQPKVVAIGECGLDYFRPKEVTVDVIAAQKEVLKKHVELAGSTNRPLIIHARPSKGTMDAYHDLIAILKEAKAKYGKTLRGDIHFFVGGVAEAEALVLLGFTVSYTAVITFARDYDQVVRSAPLTSILSETDSPYVAPASRRGSRNDPLAVEEVVAKIAEIRGEDLENVRQTLVKNAIELFKPEGITAA